MNHPVICRYALAVSAAAALLSGCGSQPPIGANGLTPDVAKLHSSAHRASNSSQALVYAFGTFGDADGIVADYPSGKNVRSFTWQPDWDQGTPCSDNEGNVYFGGMDSTSTYPAISEYAYGATSPSEYALAGPQTGEVTACSADPTTGNVAAMVHFDGPPTHVVAVFAPQLQGSPQTYADSSMDEFLSAGYDGSGNLFLLGNMESRGLELAELTKGGNSFETISLDLGSHVPKNQYRHVRWTVQWDGQYVTIAGAYAAQPNGKPKTWQNAVYRVDISGFKATIAQTILLKRAKFQGGASYAIASALNSVLITDKTFRIFGYPSGKDDGKLGIHGNTYNATIALPSSQSGNAFRHDV